MEEELRPAIREPAAAYGLASVLLWLLVSAAVSLLPVPSFVISPVEALTGLLAAVFFIYRVSDALELYVDERYYVGDGALRIRRGRALNPVTVLLQDVTEVRVDGSLIVRPFGFRTVWVYTFDCRAHPLYNLKDAGKVAEKIRPASASDLVFRASVG